MEDKNPKMKLNKYITMLNVYLGCFIMCFYTYVKSFLID